MNLSKIVTYSLFGILFSGICLSQEVTEAPKNATTANQIEGDTIMFNFEQVDVRVFAQVVGGFIGKRYTVAEDVQGTLTVISPNVSRKDAEKLFSAVLESSGFTLVRDGDMNRIVALPEKIANMGTIVTDEGTTPEYGLVTRIMRLNHVSVVEMSKMLELQLNRKDVVSTLEETNHLIITDTVSSVKKIEELVKELDKPGMARSTEVISLKHANAAELARQIMASFADNPSRAQQLTDRMAAGTAYANSVSMSVPTIVASTHSNGLVVTGTQRQIQAVKDLVAKLDIPAPSGRSSFNIIALNYIKAEDIAKNISTVVEKFAAGNGDTSLIRRVAVEAIAESNTLLVNATPEDFKAIETVIKALDVKPKQVHISVLIAEVSEGDLDKLGVTITALNAPESVGKNAFAGATRSAADNAGLLTQLSSGMFGQGLTFGIAHGSYTDANGNIVTDYPGVFNIDAIKGNDKVKILANPSLGAQNNVEAEVSVVDNIPITEATITGSGSDRDVIQNITRMDVGVKLTMTPHIIPDGIVQLELEPSIEAVTDKGISSDYAPTISKRKVKTTVMVEDGKTIVIAGLMRNDTAEVKKKIPLLGDIPLLGWLFRWNSTEEKKTNILIFVTPTVISDAAAAEALRTDLEKRTGLSSQTITEEMAVPQEAVEAE
ncbi:MAG: type II secretion system secretin GspD [Kiritimatiellae bacterium]|nr:type II secretion system secretin GspD [Kiritimatiellia bacterium]